MILKITPMVLSACIVLASASVMTEYVRADQTKETYKYYRVDAAVVSLDANQSLASYRPYGSGSGSPGSTLGYSTPVGDIRIELIVESNRFYGVVTIRDKDETDEDESQERRIELTNLRPTFLSLGTDKNGRAYQLNLTPSVVSVRLKPITFREAANDLYRLRFHTSRVVLNDKYYIGRMLASGSEVFSVDVCGIASLEFSLYPLKDAEPWGRLQNGQITLSHPDGTSIEFSNVTNGKQSQFIDGGPFVVWVRWGEAKQSVDEYRAELSAYRERVASGDAEATAEKLAAVDQELAREPGPWVISAGARGLNKNEIDGKE